MWSEHERGNKTSRTPCMIAERLINQFAELAWWTLFPKQSRHDLVGVVPNQFVKQILRPFLVQIEFVVAVCDGDCPRSRAKC